MQAIIQPGSVKGNVSAPSSKSMMQRLCAAALLHDGNTTIHHPGISEDDLAAINVIQQLGAAVKQLPGNSIEITSTGIISGSANEINCGESGLSARLFLPIAALGKQAITVTGQGSLLSRPMDTIVNLLPQLGVTIGKPNTFLPVTLQGPLTPRNVTLDGTVSSQFLSGLLFAFASASKGKDFTIEVSGLKSKPYIDLTLSVIKLFGTDISHENYVTFHIPPSRNYQKKIETSVAGDWSSAVFLLVAAAITGDITIENLDVNSQQADMAILNVLDKAGATVKAENNAVTVKKNELKGFEYNATDCPDLFPAIAILAACCEGESYIHGIHRLYHKESNRVESITEMLSQFGVFFSIEDDALYIEGRKELHNCLIDSYHDHRIAMAAAIGALCADGQVTINNAEVVSKSYPDFFTHLTNAGIVISLKQD